MIIWFATLLLASTGVLAAAGDLGYNGNHTFDEVVDCQHPGINYDESWSQVYPQSAPGMNASYVPGSVGSGRGAYQSNATGGTASFSIPFYGYGIRGLDMILTPLNETQKTLNITLSLDGTSWDVSVNATSFLNISSLDWPNSYPRLGPSATTNISTNHTLNITVRNTIATFREAMISFGTQSEVKNVDWNSAIDRNHMPSFPRSASVGLSYGDTNPAFYCLGDWSRLYGIGLGSNTAISHSMKGTPGSNCTIRLPANSTYAWINGTKGNQQGNVTFSLSSPPPADGWPTTVSTNSYFSVNTDLYETPLDPTVVYNLTMIVGQNGWAGLESVAVLSYFRKPPHDGRFWDSSYVAPNPTGPNTGVIAGAAVGSVVGLAAIATVAFIVWRKRRQKNWRNQVAPLSEAEQPTLEPFPITAGLQTLLPVETGDSTESSRGARAGEKSTLLDDNDAGPSSSGGTFARDGGPVNAEPQFPPLYDPAWRGGGGQSSTAAATGPTDEGAATAEATSTSESTFPKEKQ